jgi:cytochrome c
VDNGREVYAKLQCAKCHGTDGRGVGPSASSLLDADGRYINTRDFTVAASYRTGFNEREITRTMETGMNGTPMPSYTGIVSAKDEYDMVAYLMSLAGHGSNQHRQAAKSMEGVGAPARVIQVREHAWKYETLRDSCQGRRGGEDRIFNHRQRSGRGARVCDRRGRSERVHERRDGGCAAVDDVPHRYARPLHVLLRDAVQHDRSAPSHARHAGGGTKEPI